MINLKTVTELTIKERGFIIPFPIYKQLNFRKMYIKIKKRKSKF